MCNALIGNRTQCSYSTPIPKFNALISAIVWLTSGLDSGNRNSAKFGLLAWPVAQWRDGTGRVGIWKRSSRKAGLESATFANLDPALKGLSS